MRKVFALLMILPLLFSACKREERGEIYINGRIEGDEYDASTKYPGKVEKVLAKEGDWVKKGQVLALIDSGEVEARREAALKAYQAALKEAEALRKEVEVLREKLKAQKEKLRELRREVELSQEIAKERLKRALANLKGAEEVKEKAWEVLKKAERDYERFRNLYLKRVISKSRYEEVYLKFKEAQTSYGEAVSQVEGARALVEEAKRGIEVAENRLREVKSLEREVEATKKGIGVREENYRAALKKAESLRGKLREVEEVIESMKIRSPVEGVVYQKLVEPGEVVGAGARLFTLYNLKELYFEGFIPEDKVGLLRLGQKGYLKVDAYPKRKFPVVLTFVSTKAEFTPKEVQTKEERVKEVFKVKLRLVENPGFVLKPGMPADCYLEVGNGGS